MWVSVWLHFAQRAGLLRLFHVGGSWYEREDLTLGYSFGYSCFLSSSGSSCCSRAILIWETGTCWDGAWGGARGRGVGLWVSAGVQLQVRGGPCHALCGYWVDAGWVRRPRQGLRIQPGWASLVVESDRRKALSCLMIPTTPLSADPPARFFTPAQECAKPGTVDKPRHRHNVLGLPRRRGS